MAIGFLSSFANAERRTEAFYERMLDIIEVKFDYSLNKIILDEQITFRLLENPEQAEEIFATVRTRPLWRIEAEVEQRVHNKPPLLICDSGSASDGNWTGRKAATTRLGEGASESEFFSFNVYWQKSAPQEFHVNIQYDEAFINSILPAFYMLYPTVGETNETDASKGSKYNKQITVKTSDTKYITLILGAHVKHSLGNTVYNYLHGDTPITIIINTAK